MAGHGKFMFLSNSIFTKQNTQFYRAGE